MKPRKVMLTIETETTLPLRAFRAMRERWLEACDGQAGFEVTQIHANVVKPPVKLAKKGKQS
jgi:hypothetical protein